MMLLTIYCCSYSNKMEKILERNDLMLSLQANIFSRQLAEVFFFNFSRIQVLTLIANCLHWRETICLK